MGWNKEEADKRWKENEIRLSAMSIDDLEAELATIETSEATLDKGICEDKNYDEWPIGKTIEQATLILEKITSMMGRQDLNRHIRYKREAMCS